MMAGRLRTSDLKHFPPANIPAAQVGSAKEASFRWVKGPEGVSHRACGCALELFLSKTEEEGGVGWGWGGACHLC